MICRNTTTRSPDSDPRLRFPLTLSAQPAYSPGGFQDSERGNTLRVTLAIPAMLLGALVSSDGQASCPVFRPLGSFASLVYSAQCQPPDSCEHEGDYTTRFSIGPECLGSFWALGHGEPRSRSVS